MRKSERARESQRNAGVGEREIETPGERNRDTGREK